MAEIAEIDIKKQIANILNIELTDSWNIYDSDPDHNLYLIHYDQEADMNKYKDLRGIVVDIKAKTVVCRSYGFTPTAVKDKIELSDDGMIHITDIYGDEHTMNPEQIKMKIGFEGTIIRIFKHAGKIYLSTHRRLNTSKSRWGDSITFEKMYSQLNGPDPKSLFNEESNYSPYCHIFLMVHPDVLNVSRDQIGNGYMIYLGPKQMWDFTPENCPYKQTTKDGIPIIIKNGSIFSGNDYIDDWNQDNKPNAGWIDNTLILPEVKTQLPQDKSIPVLVSPLNINLEQVNLHLRYGFYKPYNDENLDPRIRTGEFIIIYKLDQLGQITGLLRVQSQSYQWRSEMRDNNPNLLHRFYQLLNGSYIQTNNDKGIDEYKKRFPVLTPYNNKIIQDFIKSNGPFVLWPQSPSQKYWIHSRDDRLFNIWLCFLITVPLHKQLDVSSMYHSLLINRSKVIKWLQSIEDQYSDLSQLDIPDRAKRIIIIAKDFAQKKPSTISPSGKPLTLQQLIHSNIRNLIYKEEGSSLYRLVKAMNLYHSTQL